MNKILENLKQVNEASTGYSGLKQRIDGIVSTDEKVKASATGTSEYLDNIVDGTTCVIEGNNLVVKALDGQVVSIAEINTLQGMDTNIKTLLNALASAGMSYQGKVNTKAELNLITSLPDGSVKIVLVDETQSNKRMTYIWDNSAWESIGEFNVTIRDFAVNPIQLGATGQEVVGVLPQANMDLTGVAHATDLANYTDTTTLQTDYALKAEVTPKANSVDVYTKVEADALLINKDDLSKQKHTKLLSTAYQKLNKKTNMIIVCQGDSLTYGQDTTSADKVTATGTADSGTTHTQPHALTTYPTALQTYLRDIYNNTTTVVNKGFSGDWVENSFNNWNVNSGADIALLMLGTNDADYGATWVDVSIRGNIDKYLADMRKTIKRYIEWGTAVILLTPTRLKLAEDPTNTTTHNTEAFRHALFMLGAEFGCPVIDTESFLNGCDTTYYSDSTHLNSKGYQYFASRLASVLIGFNAKEPVQIQSGSTISVRQTRDNFVSNGAYIGTTSVGTGAEENQDTYGLYSDTGATGEIFYGFETLEDNLILIPIYSCGSGGQFKGELDFGNEQGSIPLLQAVSKNNPQGVKPLSTITSSTATNSTDAYTGIIETTTTDRFLWITNKGWHNIKVSNGSGVGSVYFNGFVIMSFKDFLAQSNMLKKAPNVDATRTTIDKSVTGAINEINAAYISKQPTATTVTTDITTLSQGQYTVEGVLSTTYNYPFDSAWEHGTITVSGYGTVGQSGYRVITFIPVVNQAIYVKKQQWTGWQEWKKYDLSTASIADTISLTPLNNFTAINGYANNVRRNNNIIDFEATLNTGTIPTGTDTPIFTIPYTVKHRTLLNCTGSNGKLYAVTLSGSTVSWNGIQGNATSDLTFIVLSGTALI